MWFYFIRWSDFILKGEASHYQGFVPYKDLYEQRNQEANVIQHYLEQKDALIHSLQMQIESMNGLYWIM